MAVDGHADGRVDSEVHGEGGMRIQGGVSGVSCEGIGYESV